MKKSKGSAKVIITLVITVALILMTGCAGTNNAASPTQAQAAVTNAPEAATTAEPIKSKQPAEKKQLTIAFSVKTQDPYQKAIADGIKAIVEAAGHKFVLSVVGGQLAVNTQINQLEDLITQKVDGIVLAPMDSQAVIPVMKKAKEARIPVILVDTPVGAENVEFYLTFVGTDNFNAGKMAGEEMVKELNGSGKVFIVRGANGNAAGDQRVDGFKKGIEGSDIKVVAEQVGNWSNTDAMQAMENMLTANSKVDGVFSASDIMDDGILQALADNKRSGIKLISIDGSKAGVALIEKGDLTASIAQFPDLMGSKAAEIMLSVLEGVTESSAVEKNIDSGTAVYNLANMELASKAKF